MHPQNLDKAFRASELIVQYFWSASENESRNDLDLWTEESEENRMLFSELTDPVCLRKQLFAFDEINERKEAALRKIMREMFVNEDF